MLKRSLAIAILAFSLILSMCGQQADNWQPPITLGARLLLVDGKGMPILIGSTGFDQGFYIAQLVGADIHNVLKFPHAGEPKWAVTLDDGRIRVGLRIGDVHDLVDVDRGTGTASTPRRVRGKVVSLLPDGSVWVIRNPERIPGEPRELLRMSAGDAVVERYRVDAQNDLGVHGRAVISYNGDGQLHRYQIDRQQLLETDVWEMSFQLAVCVDADGEIVIYNEDGAHLLKPGSVTPKRIVSIEAKKLYDLRIPAMSLRCASDGTAAFVASKRVWVYESQRLLRMEGVNVTGDRPPEMSLADAPANLLRHGGLIYLIEGENLMVLDPKAMKWLRFEKHPSVNTSR